MPHFHAAPYLPFPQHNHRVLTFVKSSPFFTALSHAVGTPLVIGLAYHGSTRERLGGLDNVWGKHIDAETFEAHLKFITTHYQVVPVSTIVNCVREQKPLPRKSCFISFDDGYLGNYEVAYPLLKKYGVVASFYIATSYIETGTRYPLDILDAALKYSTATEIAVPEACLTARREAGVQVAAHAIPLQTAHDRDRAPYILRTHFKTLTEEQQQLFLEELARALGFGSVKEIPDLGPHAHFMNWQQMREMQASGMEFGSHTHHHYILARISSESALSELKTSKALLENNLGTCEQFCYPNGHYPRDGNEETDALVQQAGYSCALYMTGGAVTKNSHPYHITRRGVGVDTSLRELSAILGAVGTRVRGMVGK